MQDNTPGPIATYLSCIRELLPSVDALLSRHKNTRLCDFVDQLNRQSQSGFQSNEDFFVEIANYTSETLGSEPGKAISDDLRERPQVLTANHHGIDTFGQSTQSNLLFSMRKRADGKPFKTVPVLACGSVPLNNLTYPRGFLIYGGAEINGDSGICKLPLFPDSYKRKLVSMAGPFTPEMLARSRHRAKKLVDDGKLVRSLESALNAVFDDCSSIGQALPDYSKQATVVNHRFWQRLFRDRSCRSELVYIELECIASRLLEKDLFDKTTICYQLMFDPRLRQRLIENLDGHRGCWQYENLLQRCSGSTTVDGRNTTDSSQGTMFFWGVDAKSRKIPLCVTQDQSGKGFELRGTDDSGQLWTIPFTATDISRGLQEGRLLPSIFISYLLISIARGVSCIGGYYQADYLPVMRKAVIETLHDNSCETVQTEFIKDTPSDLYLSGMQAVGLESDGELLPAGPLEIIAGGGLDAEQYEQIGEVTVQQSHIASLYDTIIDVVPRDSNLIQSKRDVTKLVYEAVASKILTISID